MNRPIHFYVVFNPLLNKVQEANWTQAHEFYYLLKKYLDSEFSDHLYWGKILLDFNLSGLNIELFQKVLKTNLEMGHDTHLYISDYNSLWVGKVSEVKKELGPSDVTIPFYEGKKVEIWFRITDMVQMTDNGIETYDILTRLSLDHEYSAYQGEVFDPYLYYGRFPLMVTDTLDEKLFLADEKRILSDKIKQLNSKSKKGPFNINSFSIPREYFFRIPRSARGLIMDSEGEFLNIKKTSHLLLAQNYLRALEITLSDLFLWQVKKNLMPAEEAFIETGPNGCRLVVLKEVQRDLQLASGGRPGRNIKENGIIIKIDEVMKILERKEWSTGGAYEYIFADKRGLISYITHELKFHLEQNDFISILKVPEKDMATNQINYEKLKQIRQLILGIGDYGLLNQLLSYFYVYALGPVFRRDHEQHELQSPERIKRR